MTHGPSSIDTTPSDSNPGDQDEQEFGFAPDDLFSKLRFSVPGYRLVRSVGIGGQGRVYKGVRESDGLIVAVKLLHMGAFATLDERKRLRREVTALRVLKDPGIVRILDRGQTNDGIDFLVTEFIDGLSLDEYVKQVIDPNDVQEKLILFERICSAVGVAHKSGITHRDLGPANILVNRKGQPIIVDFGLARSAFDVVVEPLHSTTGHGFFLGRIEYASPEQVRSGATEISHPSDVYSLGVVLYGLFSSWQLPYPACNEPFGLANHILNDSPLPLSVNDIGASPIIGERLAAVVSIAMKKKPSERYQTAGEMARVVRDILERWSHEGTSYGKSSPGVYWAGRINRCETAASPLSDDCNRESNRSVDLTGSRQRTALIAWADQLKKHVATRGDLLGVRRIETAVEGLKKNRFNLAIIGKAKRGKSTLINALIGRSDDVVAPVDKLPTSSSITRISWGDTEKVDVSFQDGRIESVSLPQIREFVTEERNPANRKRVTVVRVAGPFSGLDRDVDLIDTPGAGSIHKYHDSLLLGFIPEADAVVFLVSARMPIDADELELLRKLKSVDVGKVFFVINRIDESSEKEILQAVEYNQQLLKGVGIPCDTIHRISARRAFVGDLTSSGLPQLAGEISRFISGNRGLAIANRFVSQVSQAVSPSVSGLELAIQSARKSTQQLQADLATLQKQKATIEIEQKFGERQFILGWAAAVSELERGVQVARTTVEREMVRRVTDFPLLQIDKLVESLPSTLVHAVESAVGQHFAKFNEVASVECERLKVHYPVITVGELRLGTFHVYGKPTLQEAVMRQAPTMAGGAGVAIAAGAVSMATLGSPVAPVLGGFLTLAGPAGWMIAGLGALAIPLSWRLAKVRQKERVLVEVRRQVDEIFTVIEGERIPALRSVGESVVQEFSMNLERSLEQLTVALHHSVTNQIDTNEIASLDRQLNGLLHLLSNSPDVKLAKVLSG